MPVELEAALAACPAQTPPGDPTKGKAHTLFLSPLLSLVAQVEGGDRGGKLWGAGEAKAIHLRHRLQQQHDFQMGDVTAIQAEGRTGEN